MKTQTPLGVLSAVDIENSGNPNDEGIASTMCRAAGEALLTGRFKLSYVDEAPETRVVEIRTFIKS